MLSGVLNSTRVVQVNIEIMRASMKQPDKPPFLEKEDGVFYFGAKERDREIRNSSIGEREKTGC
ncbi:MAG: hypothetical protein HY787_12690 [Deltaproteobacteria bacterium]|nr:hypothetical protein [Deltaproteobacteria bacterium]